MLSKDIEQQYKMSTSTSQVGGAKKDNIKKGGLQETKSKALMKSNHTIDDLVLDDFYKLADLYFSQQNIMYTHLYNSFDKWLDADIPALLKNDKNNIFFEKVTNTTIYKYRFVYDNISIKPAMMDGGEDEIMYPHNARTKDMSYSSKLVATITQVQDAIDIATDTVTSRVIGPAEHEYPIAVLPIMVRSKYCSLNLKKGNEKHECEFDPGGYFIINGSEKVIMPLEKMIENKPLVFIKKDSNATIHQVQVNSKNHLTDQMQVTTIRMKKDEEITIKVQILNEVPVFILMRAMGIESDKDIINYVVYDKNDLVMMDLVRMAIENSKPENSNVKITTKNEAMNYLISKMKVIKKYNETDKDIKIQEKKMHLLSLLKENVLPHVEGDLIKKAYYIGYMIHKLLQCYLLRVPPDDRDSFVNKRVDLPGPLLFELFKQFYKKMLNECNKIFRKHNKDDENPHNIINQIKPNIIEGGLRKALLTGAWGKKKGVAQMLQRLSTVQMYSSLRRINSPTVDASTNKLTSPRHINSSGLLTLCHVETPEGAKVGLVKHLSLVGNITVMMTDQVYVIKNKIREKISDISDISPDVLKNYTRVFLNGEWIGLTDKPRELYLYLKKMKYTGEIDIHTSIVHELKSELESKELKIHCDGGRLFHPILRVEDNSLLLTKTMVNFISLDGHKSATSITSWNEFMAKNPGVIEYIDTDEVANAMLAITPSKVVEMRDRMNNFSKINNSDELKNKLVINRYDESTYVKYTHCSIHPSLHIGVVSCNIPFCNHNQGPRNIYQYSQARQAMGIYASNYRERADISYILYHSQRPLVTTRATKYIYTDRIPAGENAVVALACYSGYNQEDSVLQNRSANDRGFMRSTSLKKAKTVVQKNQSTSQDDVFLKPDPSKVTGMRHGSYDKLNEQGHVPEETEVVNGDIIIGKVSPIQPTGGSTKTFKDNSETYKSQRPGVVDKVWSGLYNTEGYEMKKMRIRSMCIPQIGDKFCSRHGQKGTMGITLPAADMPFTSKGIQPDIIMNPNAIPKRMTVGQLIECVVGKVSAIEGHETDGTPFNNPDIEAVKDILESLGYERNGYEELYNGMTGRKLMAMIFIGPIYYQRLKHMVNDKIHSRATGPRTVLTHQPPEGRSRDGGLRFGEMERDSIISHGLSRFLKERLLETADVYVCYVCAECGLFAQRMLRRDNKEYSTANDTYWCPACKNKTNIHKIKIPYAFKLLLQEMMSMSIAPRIRVKANAFNS